MIPFESVQAVLTRLDTWAVNERINIHEYIGLLKELSFAVSHLKKKREVLSSPRHIIRGMLFIAYHNHEYS